MTEKAKAVELLRKADRKSRKLRAYQRANSIGIVKALDDCSKENDCAACEDAVECERLYARVTY